MPSAKPPREDQFEGGGGTFDSGTFSQRLHEEVTKDDGSKFAIFDPVSDTTGKKIGLPRFVNWVRRLRDVINANAEYLDEVKEDLVAHKAADLTRHQAINSRLSVLEAQGADPFPASISTGDPETGS